MGPVQGIGRRVLMVVALLATMYGLLHTHAISAPTPAQTCLVCVTSQTAMAPTPSMLPAPPVREVPAAPSHVAAVHHFDGVSVPSRAPPRG
jgi:hypothetical protein